MFETAALTSGPGSKRIWGMFAGIGGQALLVTCAVIAPMIWPAALPHTAWITGIEAPGPPAPPPPGDTLIRPKTAVRAESQFRRGLLVEPTRFPARAATLIEDAPAMAGAGGVEGGVAGGEANGVVGGILRSVMSEGSRVPAVVKPPEPVATPLKTTVATVVKPPRLSALELAHPIHRVDPTYPPLARQMRVSGVVELQGVLGADGRIHELKVLRGHPLLAKAALDAVSQWTYAPAILNGQAVEVVAPIIVTFTLN